MGQSDLGKISPVNLGKAGSVQRAGMGWGVGLGDLAVGDGEGNFQNSTQSGGLRAPLIRR